MGVSGITPLPPRKLREQRPWAAVTLEEDRLVLTLSGWRQLWAMKRKVEMPFEYIIAVEHDPEVYTKIQTRVRLTRRTGTRLFRVGAYHGWMGWSFWSCGTARNAVVVETIGTQFRWLVVEVPEPLKLVRSIREATGMKEPSKPARRKATPETRRRLRPIAGGGLPSTGEAAPVPDPEAAEAASHEDRQ
jgi:hypothetical protein